MKITKSELREIIKEEIERYNTLNERINVRSFFEKAEALIMILGMPSAALLAKFGGSLAWNFVAIALYITSAFSLLGSMAEPFFISRTIDDLVRDYYDRKDEENWIKNANFIKVGNSVKKAVEESSELSEGQRKYIKAYHNKIQKAIKDKSPKEVYKNFRELTLYLKRHGKTMERKGNI